MTPLSFIKIGLVIVSSFCYATTRADTVINWATDTNTAFDLTIDGFISRTDYQIPLGEFVSPSGLWEINGLSAEIAYNFFPGRDLLNVHGVEVDFLGNNDGFHGYSAPWGDAGNPVGGSEALFLYHTDTTYGWAGSAFIEATRTDDSSNPGWNYEWHIFGIGPALNVPDTGSSLGLFGISLLTLVALHRKFGQG